MIVLYQLSYVGPSNNLSPHVAFAGHTSLTALDVFDKLLSFVVACHAKLVIERSVVPGEGFGHKYLPAGKFCDPASLAYARCGLRILTVPNNSRTKLTLGLRILVPGEGFEPP